ncbi:MAG TPA: photosynthetic reaction center cytochrome c subunit family protein [Pyrinomonadaceae bacterium]|nr:photosynthetic reaction center cytochrome c subunit family protein [Pyrinomonadaceae bacterium]
MKKKFKLVAVIVFVLLCACSLFTGRGVRGAGASAQPPQGKTAEQVYKNIQVFKGLPASQLQGAMSFMADSLGVGCGYCHGKSFESDEKPTKQAARGMIRMVFDLNKDDGGTFRGAEVSCYTCHRGSPRPVSVPAITRREPNTNAQAKAATAEAPLPTVEQVLEKYVQALGGREALAKLKTRFVKGSRVGADGVLVPEEIYQKAPDKLAVATSYPNVTFRSGFDGARAWARDSRGADQLNDQFAEALRREAEFFNGVRLKELYPQMTAVSREVLGGRETYVVSGPASDAGADKLYFDAQTGLLVRRYVEFKTALGRTPVQVDYEDYREVDGVKLPFQLRWSNPRYSWGRKVDEVKHNVPVDDAKFNPPALK